MPLTYYIINDIINNVSKHNIKTPIKRSHHKKCVLTYTYNVSRIISGMSALVYSS